MTTSRTVSDYLAAKGISARTHRHPRSMTVTQAAHSAHVPEKAFAKAVVLQDGEGVFLAVLPASFRIVLGELWRETHRPARLASESEIKALFPDCDLGAVPPFGDAYHLDTVLDKHLLQEPFVYCEGGDHETMLELAGADFAALMASARVGNFGQARDAENPVAHPS